MFISAGIKIFLLCVFLNVSQTSFRTELVFLFSINGTSLRIGLKTCLLALLISPYAVRNAHFCLWLERCTGSPGAVSGICLSVKSNLLIATGSLHLRYLQLYKDQASCLGEPRKAICLARRWVSEHFPVVSHPMSWVRMGASECFKEALLLSNEVQKRERSLGAAGSCPSPRLCLQLYNFITLSCRFHFLM